MRKLRILPAPSRRNQEGQALVIFALLLLVLIGFVGLGIDVGLSYIRVRSIQQAADAAALAGVIVMPGNFGPSEPYTGWSSSDNNIKSAVGRALMEAGKNGFPYDPDNQAIAKDGTNPDGTRIVISSVPGYNNRLKVTITNHTQLVFLRLLGIKDFPLTRTATAEYLKPVPMGSPLNIFGYNDPAQPSDEGGGYWAAIQGPDTATSTGDYYSAKSCTGSRCSTIDGVPNTSKRNPYYNPNGYNFAIEIPPLDDAHPNTPATGNISVWVYDPAMIEYGDNLGEFPATTDHFFGGGSFTTLYTLYPPTDPPVDTTQAQPNYWKNYNLSYTDAYMNPSPINKYSGTTPIPKTVPHYQDFKRWVQMGEQASVSVPLTFTPSVGIYRLNIRTTQGNGDNRFGIRVTSTGKIKPRVYGLDQICIYTPITPEKVNQSTNFDMYLADVGPDYASMSMDVQLFDPGDVDGGVSVAISILPPDSDSVPGGKTYPFKFTSTLPNAPNQPSPDGNGNVSQVVAATSSKSAIFNDHVVHMTVQLPNKATYDSYIKKGYCNADGTGCWWKVRYTVSKTGNGQRANDTTTWSIRISGDPVHLVE